MELAFPFVPTKYKVTGRWLDLIFEGRRLRRERFFSMGTPIAAAQQPPVDISKALHGLFNEVISGTAHLNAAKSLAKASKTHPVIINASPAFFNLTTRAHLEAAQLCAARLFDDHRDCAGIPWLLKQARHRREEFSYRTADELDEAIKEAEQMGSLGFEGRGRANPRLLRFSRRIRRTVVDVDPFPLTEQTRILSHPERL
jgi:hypothetical protein